MTQRLLHLFLLLIMSAEAFAQNGKLFNTENGLSSTLATQVLQSDDGRIFITTRNGLNVYNGYSFKVINQTSAIGKNLESNYFNSICKGHGGKVFVGTNTGLLSFDGKKFTHYYIYDDRYRFTRTYINNVSVCHDGTILASTSGFGIQIISPQSKDTVCTRIKGALGKYDYISKTMEDRQRRLWAVTPDDKLLCRQANGRLITAFKGLGNAKVTCISEDGKGHIYVGTKESGLFKLIGNNTFERLKGFPPLHFYCITMTSHGTLLAGTNGNGIIAYDTKSGTVSDNPFYSNLVSLNHGKIGSILEDRNGNIWIAMLQKGVFMQPSVDFKFHYQGPRLGSRNSIGDFSVNSVLLSRNGHMWVGTDMGGLYELDDKGNRLRHFEKPAPKTIMSLAEDHQGRIWIGSYSEGCGYIDGGNYHPINLVNGAEPSIFDIAVDDDGTLYFVTMGEGVIKLDNKGHKTIIKSHPDAYNNQKTNSLPNNFISDIVLSRDKRHIFIATTIGLACYDKAKRSWTNTFGTNCLHKNTMIICIFEDSKGRLWYGCGSGLWQYDFKTRKERHFNTQNGLPSNNISAIAEDKLGRIWVTTKHGLSCLNPDNGKATNFFANNGLQSNEFGDHAFSRNTDGSRFLMGGMGGITWFNPLLMHQTKWNANVMITEVLSGDNKDTLDDSNLTFKHDDNSFTLFLSTNTYNDVEQITYAYKIDDGKWNTIPQGTNNLMFNSMPAGKNKLRLKAIRNGQETPVKEYTIKVKAAWYATTWAKMVYLILFCVFVWLARRDHKRKQHLKHILSQMKEIKKFVVPINKDIETQTPDDKLIGRIMKYINNNLSNSELSVEQIADAVGISRVHLHRKMKEITGQTPHALIKNLRLRQAAKLLEDPKQSITEVVYACGFNNSASFSTMFKTAYGVSPREYQKGKRAEKAAS